MSLEGGITIALLVITAIANTALFVANRHTKREVGEALTKQDLQYLEDRVDDAEKAIAETGQRFHDKLNRVDGKFGAYVTRIEHDKDIAHIQQLFSFVGPHGPSHS